MKKVIILFLTILFLSQGVGYAKPTKITSQLDLRQIQTHLFNTNDTKQVQKAIFSALQDGGFVITNIENELGYITAFRDFKEKRTNKAIVTTYSSLIGLHMACLGLSFGMNPAAAYGIVDTSLRIKNEITPKLIVVSTNVLIEPYGKQTKVRVLFVERVHVHADGHSYVRPAIRTARRIDEPLVYQEFFAEIDKSLFLAKNNV